MFCRYSRQWMDFGPDTQRSTVHEQQSIRCTYAATCRCNPAVPRTNARRTASGTNRHEPTRAPIEAGLGRCRPRLEHGFAYVFGSLAAVSRGAVSLSRRRMSIPLTRCRGSVSGHERDDAGARIRSFHGEGACGVRTAGALPVPNLSAFRRAGGRPTPSFSTRLALHTL